MITAELIKKNLGMALKRSGLTQAELASRLMVSQSCIAHYQRGDILPGLDTFANLCSVLDEDPAELLGLKEK